MNRIRCISRLIAVLAGLAWAPAAVPAITRVVVAGGMPGWQIALISICAPVPAPGPLSLGCHRGPLRCRQQTRPGRKP